MLDKVDEMRSQRRLLIKDFGCDLESDDISKKALSERDMDRQNFFRVELGKHDRNLELINLNLQAQDAILKRLTEVNANFAEYRQKIIETAKRYHFCLGLITYLESSIYSVVHLERRKIHY